MLSIKKNLKIVFMFLSIQTLLFAGYSTDISSTTSGNSYWGSSILKFNVRKISGNYLYLRVEKKDGGSFTSTGTLTIRENSTTGNILQTKTLYEGSSYKDFSGLNMAGLIVTLKNYMHIMHQMKVVGHGLDRFLLNI